MEVKGHEIIDVACNGLECIDKLKESQELPDFIIMDHYMPVKNGLETMNDLLSIKPGLKIIFISSEKTIEEEVLEKGAVGFIEKPFNMQTFFNTINKFAF